MLEQFTSQEKKKFLIALLIGLGLGFAANYGLQPKIAQQPNALAEMSSKIKFGTITESVKQCTVVADEAVLYSEPSTLTGRVLRSLPNGMQTNHLATVASLDKDDNKAAAAYDLEFKKFFFQTVYIPKGTPFTIKSETAAQYYCSFKLKDRLYTKHFPKELVKKAYTGSWYRVEAGADTGYVPAAQTTAPRYL